MKHGLYHAVDQSLDHGRGKIGPEIGERLSQKQTRKRSGNAGRGHGHQERDIFPVSRSRARYGFERRSPMKETIQTFLRNAKASPKTTATGLAGLIGSISSAIHNPSVLSSTEWWMLVLVSGGLLFAGDATAKA